MYELDQVPDHIVHEIDDFNRQLVELIFPLIENFPPNIVLASLNFIHAGVIKNLVSDNEEELRKAASIESLALIKNIEFISGIKILPEKEE